jgi:glutathione S-transferase
MIVVHHLENSRSQRILWLLEELELEYEIKRYERDPKTQLAPASLKKVHPLGRSPVITDGEQTVAESGAIIEFIANRYDQGRLLPKAESPERLRCTYWLHYAEGTLMPLFLLRLVLSRFSQSPVPLLLRPVGGLLAAGFDAKFTAPRIQENLAFINDQLGQSEWFAGDHLSIADVQMSFPLEAALARVDSVKKFSRIVAFVERVQSRPAYQRAIDRGGDYAYAL